MGSGVKPPHSFPHFPLRQTTYSTYPTIIDENTPHIMKPLSRSETLQILIDMGINLPITTKLSADALEKRVRDALNASQNRVNIPAQLEPSSLPGWPMMKPWNDTSGSGGRSIFDAVRRSSYQEMGEHLLAMRAGQVYNPSPLYTNAFMDLRQTIMSIGQALDNGQRWCLLQDRGGQIFAMNIRVSLGTAYTRHIHVFERILFYPYFPHSLTH